jgi:predicted amidohydrolase YtcJ
MKKQNILLLTIIIVVVLSTIVAAEEMADLVIRNAKIITVDDSNTIAQAVAVKDSLILKVGTNKEIQAFINASTEVYNLDGLTVTPGIIDAHSHLMFYGVTVNEYVNLREIGTQTIADVVVKIEERVKQVQPGDWIMGDGFFKLERMPTRDDLDPVSPENPVFLQSLGGHYGSCNSKALEIAGVDKNTPDPVGGIIERDSLSGEPNGVLWNHPAMDVVRMYHPPISEASMTSDVVWAQEDYIKAGYTSFQDVNVRGVSRLRAYSDAKDSLKIRGYILFTIETTRDAQLSYDSLTVTPDPWLSLMGDKFLVDGQPPTAYTHEPHIGPSYDMPTWNPDTLKRVVKDLHRAGHQLSFHVMGDAAIDLALDAIEEALKETPRDDHRHRLEHVFIPTKAAIQRMKDLNVIVSVQPSMIYTGGDFYTQLFGNDIIQRLVPIRSFLDAGIPVALGTDWPTIVLLHPRYTLWSSIVRRTLTGAVIAPEERITIQEALRLHTMGSAYAAFEEDVKGSIEEGKYADMTIWSDDLYSVPVEEIPNLFVKSIVVGGTVYENLNVHVDNKSEAKAPENFKLFYNYPNPFNPSTRIIYSLDKQGYTTLKVYNSLGQVVKTLVDYTQLSGKYIITWDGFDYNGSKVPSGQYYFQLKQGDNLIVKKALLVK